MMNWSEFEEEEIPRQRPIVLPLLIWLGIVGCVIVLLSGCASEPKSPRIEVCFMQFLGQTDSGVPVVKTACMTPEQFEESQK